MEQDKEVQELLEKNTTTAIVSALLEELEGVVTFEEEKHRYFVKDGQGNPLILPSVTQIISPYAPDLTKIPSEILQQKQQIGVAVHKRAEGEEVSPFEQLEGEVNPALQGYCDAIDKYMKDYEGNPRGVYHKEVRLFNPILMYAGATDCLEIIDDTITIVDYKTVAKINRKNILLQLVGYYLALVAMGVDKIMAISKTARIVQLKPDGEYQIHKVTITDDAINVFTALVQLHYYFKEE